MRIYWGVVQPIRLQEFDNVPSVPSPTSWRHSFIPGDRVPDIKPDLKVRTYIPCEDKQKPRKEGKIKGYLQKLIFIN